MVASVSAKLKKLSQTQPARLLDKSQPLERRAIVTKALIETWALENDLQRGELYDQIAMALAVGFTRSYLDFEFCDQVANDLHAIMTLADEARPSLFWEVYNAFDEGEYDHGDGSAQDPVERYTRPQIALVVEKYSARYPDMS